MKSMRVYDKDAYSWNHRIAPEGNMANVSPTIVSQWCDVLGIPWYSFGEPYSSGILVYCESNDIWSLIIRKSTMKKRS